MKIIGNAWDAMSEAMSAGRRTQNVVSEVFEKVLNALPSYDEKKASLSTWIYAITRNTVTDFYRKNSCLELCELPETAAEPEENELEALAEQLESLPQRERDILLLRFYYGLTPREIAGRMNISYANVRYLQSTALKKLKANF